MFTWISSCPSNIDMLWWKQSISCSTCYTAWHYLTNDNKHSKHGCMCVTL